ncbi:hypothetical protein HDV01_004265 [Terramyces sp. JEL0728]|nr:hypothetical protein HDV01_004265 [Terramyces sp. JEL0728]
MEIDDIQRYLSPMALLLIYKKYHKDYKQRLLEEFMDLKMYLANTPIKSALLTELATIGLKSVKHKKKQPVIDFDSWKTYILLIDILHLVYERKEFYYNVKSYSNRVFGEFNPQSSQQISNFKKIFDKCPLLLYYKPLLETEFIVKSNSQLFGSVNSPGPSNSDTSRAIEENGTDSEHYEFKILDVNTHYKPSQRQYPKTQSFLYSINKRRTQKYNQKRELIKSNLSSIKDVDFIL